MAPNVAREQAAIGAFAPGEAAGILAFAAGRARCGRTSRTFEKINPAMTRSRRFARARAG